MIFTCSRSANVDQARTGLMELAVTLNRDDRSYRHVWAVLPVLYFGGLAWTRKRYA